MIDTSAAAQKSAEENIGAKRKIKANEKNRR